MPQRSLNYALATYYGDAAKMPPCSTFLRIRMRNDTFLQFLRNRQVNIPRRLRGLNLVQVAAHYITGLSNRGATSWTKGSSKKMSHFPHHAMVTRHILSVFGRTLPHFSMHTGWRKKIPECLIFPCSKGTVMTKHVPGFRAKKGLSFVIGPFSW